MNYNTRKGNRNNIRRVHSDTNRAVMLMVWLLVLIILGATVAHNTETAPVSKPASSDTTPVFEDGPDAPDTYVPAIPETVEVVVPPATETAPEVNTEPVEVTIPNDEKVVAVEVGSDSSTVPSTPVPVEPTTPVDDEEQIYLPYCEQEDSTTCYWDATRRGNGIGRSFVNISGTTYYLP